MTYLPILFIGATLSLLNPNPQPETQCMLKAMSEASATEILKGWKFTINRPARQPQLKFLLKNVREEDGSIDSRVLALSWMENRMRIGAKRGDRGKACGIFQIHARHSYPMFRRKGGWRDWDAKEESREISSECRKLERTKYSISTMRKLLDLMDKNDLHPCHHNSGVKGKCNAWYKRRLDHWITYFDQHQVLCDRRVQTIMAMLKTGNPIPTAPAPLMQGYLDAMSGKDAQSDDSVYKSGYDLANLVKEGKAEAPSWAVDPTDKSEETSGEG